MATGVVNQEHFKSCELQCTILLNQLQKQYRNSRKMKYMSYIPL